MRHRPLRRLASRVCLWCAVSLVVCWTVFPFWWALVYSIKPNGLGYRSVLVPFVQFRPTLAHWRWEWDNRYDVTGLFVGLRNSFVVSFATATTCCALGLLAAVGLRSFQEFGRPRRALVSALLLPRIVPPVILLTPLYLLATSVRMNDTLLILILLNTSLGLPLALMVLNAAVRDLPADVLHAARLDGASTIGIVRDMIVPLTAPVIWAVGVLTFALSWSEFLFAVTNAGRNSATATISIAFLDQRDGVDFEHVGSHIVLIMILPLILAMLTQRVLVRGLALGAVKG